MAIEVRQDFDVYFPVLSEISYPNALKIFKNNFEFASLFIMVFLNILLRYILQISRRSKLVFYRRSALLKKLIPAKKKKNLLGLWACL